MAKTFRHDPDEDWNRQLSAKERKQLRKADKQARKDRDARFDELEESAEVDM